MRSIPVALSLLRILVPTPGVSQDTCTPDRSRSTQSDRSIPAPVPRLSAPIEPDGWTDESAWEVIEPLRLIMFEPIAGAEPTDRTEIRLAYDDEYLYVAGRFYVDDPSQIQATSLYRDPLSADDTFRLLLDTFDDNEHAVVFSTNPAGVRVDEAIAW